MSLKWIILIAIILMIVLKRVFHINLNWVYYLIINIVIGVALIWFINLSGVLFIPFTVFSKTVTGIFGVPGVMCLSLMALVGWI